MLTASTRSRANQGALGSEASAAGLREGWPQGQDGPCGQRVSPPPTPGDASCPVLLPVRAHGVLSPGCARRTKRPAFHRIEWRRSHHRPSIPCQRHPVHREWVCAESAHPRSVTAAQAEPSGALRRAGNQPYSSRRPRDPSAARGSPTVSIPTSNSSTKRSPAYAPSRRGRSRRHRPPPGDSTSENHPPGTHRRPRPLPARHPAPHPSTSSSPSPIPPPSAREGRMCSASTPDEGNHRPRHERPLFRRPRASRPGPPRQEPPRLRAPQPGGRRIRHRPAGPDRQGDRLAPVPHLRRQGAGPRARRLLDRAHGGGSLGRRRQARLRAGPSAASR